jgi:hypothetical protein
MIGQVEGLRRQGRPRLRWTDSIKDTMGLGLEILKEIVKDRNKWRRLVEEKTTNREQKNINIKSEKGKAMANHPWTHKIV